MKIANRVTANGLTLIVDNDVDDIAIQEAPPQPGTTMRLRFVRPPKRALQAVFEEWTDEFEFSRTRTVVKLFGLGRDFVSRSEARRLLQADRSCNSRRITCDHDKCGSRHC